MSPNKRRVGAASHPPLKLVINQNQEHKGYENSSQDFIHVGTISFILGFCP